MHQRFGYSAPLTRSGPAVNGDSTYTATLNLPSVIMPFGYPCLSGWEPVQIGLNDACGGTLYFLAPYTTYLCDTCGNGTIDAGEYCDDADGSGCGHPGSWNCTNCQCVYAPGCPGCGNGNRNFGEACDPGMTLSEQQEDCGFEGAFCGQYCTCIAPTCGNGIAEPFEACDSDADCGDPFYWDCDACNSCNLEQSTTAFCGDGTVTAPVETCDPANTTQTCGDGTFCSSWCSCIARQTATTCACPAGSYVLGGYCQHSSGADGFVCAEGGGTFHCVPVTPRGCGVGTCYADTFGG